MATVTLNNSSYLDWTSYHTTSATTPQDAFSFTSTQAASAGDQITVAFIINRANDPTALLNQSWAERQSTLAGMDQTTLWNTYGADATTYNTVVSDLQAAGATVQLNSDEYVSSAQSRTVWATLSTAKFNEIFHTTLMRGDLPSGSHITYWDGELSVDSSWNIGGLWFDKDPLGITPQTAVSDLSGGASVELTPGALLGTGNFTSHHSVLNPYEIAKYYNFPSLGATASYGVTGLVEPEVGITYDSSNTIDPTGFEALLNAYLSSQNVSGQASVYTVGSSQTYSSNLGGERSLDVAIAAAVTPASQIGIFAGSGTSSNFIATQQALWSQYGTAQQPGVIASSFRDDAYLSPNSPFLTAYTQLYVDAALLNVTSVTSTGDLGSGHNTANGIPNVANTKMSPYQLTVGGSSASTLNTAALDPTLTDANGIYTKAMAGDLATLKMLVAGGLRAMPASLGHSGLFLETVWNRYHVDANGEPVGYSSNQTASGGVDTSQPTPGYQTAYGLSPEAAGPLGGFGRGLPDVVLDAGGNMVYLVPGSDMSGTSDVSGSSAAAPMWAALTTKLNAIFADQGLPQLGYMNDLLYIANVIAPGSFNDIQVGNNTSSYWLDGSGNIVPTGYGYPATEGFDLASGLGSPNGLLLARALTQIAHAQTYYASVPDLLDQQGGNWISGTNQTLLVQSALPGAGTVEVNGTSFASPVAASSYAWSAQFAQQVMQQDFSADLVGLFDRMSQGQAGDMQAAANAAVSVSIGGSAAAAPHATLSTAFGFADFENGHGGVSLARPVAVAELAGGVAQDVAVRVRQAGTNDLSVIFYKVDDFNGTVGGIHVGQAGYAQAASGAAYQLSDGHTSLHGPGFGQFTSATLEGVQPGDLIAMRLTDHTHNQTYYAFSAGNGDGLGHIWNYGLNTWGWEDTAGGGDLDYNDLVVQLDFTSASGSGWLLHG